MRCENAKGGERSFGLPQCHNGEACVTLRVFYNSEHPKDEEDLNLCLECTDRIEEWADGHGDSTRIIHVKPTVGMPATVGVGGDRYPYTVTAVSKSGKSITIQRDQYKAAEGSNFFGAQKWEVVRDTEGHLEKWTLRSNGRWCRQGDSMRYSNGLSLGWARPHQDPHF